MQVTLFLLLALSVLARGIDFPFSWTNDVSNDTLINDDKSENLEDTTLQDNLLDEDLIKFKTLNDDPFKDDLSNNENSIDDKSTEFAVPSDYLEKAERPVDLNQIGTGLKVVESLPRNLLNWTWNIISPSNPETQIQFNVSTEKISG